MDRRGRWTVGAAAMVVVALLVSCAPSDPALPPVVDPALVALDIVPAGSFSPPSGGDVGVEARMYDSLATLGAEVTDADVASGFKSAGLDWPAGERPRRVERPAPGVLIRRDRFNVPYVTAATDRDARWAVGWLAASHAPLVYDVARRNARIAAMRVPDVDVFGLSAGLVALDPSAAAEAALDRQLDELAALPDGAEVLADVRAFVRGYNARLDATLSPLQRWTPRDVVALAAFKSSWWGGGTTEYVFPGGAPSPGAQARLAGTGPSPHAPGDAHGVPSYRPNEVRQASNFALVSAERSATGHPMMIGGPQIGFLYPSVLFEVVVHAPGISVRGMTAPSLPGYVLIGRASEQAWTLNVTDATTSVGVVVPMCDPNGAPLTERIEGFELDGVCHPVSRTRVGTLRSLTELSAPPTRVERVDSEYGPVGFGPFGFYGDSGEVVLFQNPSAGKDHLELAAYRAVERAAGAGPEAFRDAIVRTPQAFTVGYVDAEHIAAVRTCACVRAPEDGRPVADPASLLVPADQQAFVLDPPGGVVTNWNEYLVADGRDFVPPAPGEFRREWFEAFDAVAVHDVRSMVASMNGEAAKESFGPVPFLDLVPFLGGPRPPAVTAYGRSTGIQMVMSFGDG